MDKSFAFKTAAVLCVLGLSACSEAPNVAPPEKKSAEATAPAPPPEAIAAKSAFFSMYKPAQAWASDLLPLSMVPGEAPGVKNEEGKAGMWTCIFVSPSRREARAYTYAVVENGSTPRGVTAEPAQVWSGATRESQPFQLADFMVNSDAAYKTAFEKASPWVKKHPEKKLAYSLASAARFPAPVWFFMWGDRKLGFAVFVNATTGDVIGGK